MRWPKTQESLYKRWLLATLIEAGLNGTQRNNVPKVEIPWEVTDYRFQPQGVYVKTLTSPDRERGDLSVHDVMLGN